MGKTGIEWTDETWPVTRGCTPVSPGCKHCYAKAQAARIIRMGKGAPTKYDGLVHVVDGDPRWTNTARFCPEELATPLRERKGRRIFVSSMSDLLHDDITNEQIAAVFRVMAACPQHTFQVLTKRPRRMREWFEWVEEHGISEIMREATAHLFGNGYDTDRLYTWWRDRDHRIEWPLPNVHLGVSCENQDAADERIPELLRTPAAVRFLSIEPMLGPVDLKMIDDGSWYDSEGAQCYDATMGHAYYRDGEHGLSGGPRLDWVIAGCESGPGARPADSAWYRSLRDQCAGAGVAFFLKQAREEGTWEGDNEHECTVLAGPGSHRKPGGIIGAPYLDGVQHLAFPQRIDGTEG